MHLHNGGPYFEFFAGLNLAYAGIDQFRRKVFEILSALFTPENLEPEFKSIANKTEALKGIDGAGEQWSQDFIHRTTEIEDEYARTEAELKEQDEKFLNDIQVTRPLFLIGFLFCLNNLIAIGFEDFFYEHNTLLAEQWLCVSFIFMLIVYRKPSTMLGTWLRHHFGVILSAATLLAVALTIGCCPHEFGGIPHSSLFTTIVAVIIPLVPLALDYWAVRQHTKRRNKTKRDYIAKARSELGELDTTAQVIQRMAANHATPSAPSVVAGDEGSAK